MGYHKMKTIGILIILTLAGCTYSTGNLQTGKFMIIDLHPGGEAVTVDATIEGKGSLEVQRSTGDSTEVLSVLSDAVTGLPLP
jgi:hypothetical protein